MKIFLIILGVYENIFYTLTNKVIFFTKGMDKIYGDTGPDFRNFAPEKNLLPRMKIWGSPVYIV